MTDRHLVAVRWRDLDHLGHVYHATILTMLDEARTEWLTTKIGVEKPDSYVLARIELDYRRPLLRSDDALAVEFVPSRVGTTSVTISERAFAGASGALIAEAKTTIVLWNRPAAAPREISIFERQRLTENLEPSEGNTL